MAPLADTRLTCISNFPVATYSGMLPGVLAKQYSPDRMQIDLVRLCAAAGARLIVDRFHGLDTEKNLVLFEERAPIRFDLLAIGIGSLPDLGHISGAAEHAVAIKPMQTFLDRLAARLRPIAATISAGGSARTPATNFSNTTSQHPAGSERQSSQESRYVRVAIVGGGAGGVEVAFCLPAMLGEILGQTPFHLTLLSGSEELIGGVSEQTSAAARRTLESRGVAVITGRKVASINSDHLTLDDGEQVAADLVICATHAIADPVLSRLGLATDEAGFLLTRPTLQSLTADNVFVVGDSGTIRDRPTPKAGVYAVRQGAVLWENIGRAFRGQKLVEFRPQQGFLKLFNYGNGQALGEYKGVTLEGRWVWKLKDWIDSRFMKMYQDYRPMQAAVQESVPPTDEMRCGGCGCKVGGDVLSRVLAQLKIPPHEQVVLGLGTPDDVAVIRPSPGSLLTLTVDFFSAPFDDPYTLGRIAALNSASDCFAKGAKPVAALASITVPLGSSDQQEAILLQLLSGALREFQAMGATLVGGHTIEGAPLTVGFTVVADQQQAVRAKDSLRTGDRLILTKPLGTGVLLAAHMRARCKAPWWQSMMQSMLASNHRAAELLADFDVRSATDVTGFGLAGHLLEMLRASGKSAEVCLNSVPLLEGTLDLLREGLESTLAPANRSVQREIDAAPEVLRRPEYSALFDPQTSGGLLIAVGQDDVAAVMDRLRSLGEVPAAVIGHVTEANSSRRLRVN